MHESFPALYERLLADVKKESDCTKRLCAFALLRGRNWTGDVIFYGRALNQWVTEFCAEDIASEELRSGKARQICESGYTLSICKLDPNLIDDGSCDDDPMHWVHHSAKLKEYQKCTEKTPFWNVIGEVIRSRHPAAAAAPNWASWAAWSNLYKVAPAAGKNPNERLKKAQLGICKQLLAAEIGALQPRALVFLTEANRKEYANGNDFEAVDEHGWVAPFLAELGVRTDDLRPLPSSLRNGGKILVHSGAAKIAEHQIGIVAALRPEHLKVENLSRQILSGINSTSNSA